jgi:hypothetical protein
MMQKYILLLTCQWSMFDKVSSNLIFIHRDNTEVLNGSNNLGLVKFALTIPPSVRIIFLTLKATRFHEVTEG